MNIDFLHRRMKRKKRTSLHLPQLWESLYLFQWRRLGAADCGRRTTGINVSQRCSQAALASLLQAQPWRPFAWHFFGIVESLATCKVWGNRACWPACEANVAGFAVCTVICERYNKVKNASLSSGVFIPGDQWKGARDQPPYAHWGASLNEFVTWTYSIGVSYLYIPVLYTDSVSRNDGTTTSSILKDKCYFPYNHFRKTHDIL